MQPDAEARVRVALAELGDALIELARSRSGTSEPGPVELYAPGRFSALSGLGRSTVYLAIADGSIRSTKVRGRRLIPSTELSRLAAAAPPPVSKKKPARVSDAPRTGQEVRRALDERPPAA